ncbi:hypothetical protein MNBD_GAMMA15-1537 [hydrothermal vent metagenome]|uniref:Uncharacterized protein n=1 Tax=hydrothermal vent metagenome TaxID=652676 RepID=A0A3B0YVW9_9ZZZZ
MASAVTTFLASGQLARLIPTVADSKKEERATSSLLSSFAESGTPTPFFVENTA